MHHAKHYNCVGWQHNAGLNENKRRVRKSYNRACISVPSITNTENILWERISVLQSSVHSVGVVAADAWRGCGALLAAEDCEFGPTSTRLALADNSQTQREAIRGKWEKCSTPTWQLKACTAFTWYILDNGSKWWYDWATHTKVVVGGSHGNS